jgi:hypothetical protein
MSSHGVLPLERANEPPQNPLGTFSLIPSLGDVSEELGSLSPVSGEFSERGRGENERGRGHAGEITGHAGQRLEG